jgi:hypothetical protein
MLTFRHALEAAGVNSAEVCVLRHQDARADPGRTPYQLFLRDRPAFEQYQAVQTIENRSRLRANYWAAFVGTPGRGTLFCGLYACRYLGVSDVDLPRPHQQGQVDKEGQYDRYDLRLQEQLNEYIGLMFVEWGEGWRSWIQRNTEKPIVELHRRFQEPRYPGHLAFVSALSELDASPYVGANDSPMQRMLASPTMPNKPAVLS